MAVGARVMILLLLASSVSSAAICFATQYYLSGTGCKTCQTGYFCPGDDDSYSCPAGYYCPTTGMDRATPCPAGYYCLTTGLSSATRCPVAYYCPTTKMTFGIPCAPGYFCPTTNMSSGTPCQAGYYCPTGVTSGTPCATGYYCPTTGMSSGIPCAAGYYCATTGLSSATACGAGHYCPTTGMTGIGPSCPMGYYCPTGVALGIPCSPGYFCATTGMSSGIPCQAGYYCPTGVTSGILCAPGYYCPTTGLSSGIACPRGYFCPVGAANNTDLCSKGHYCPDVAMAAELTCPPGFYCPSTGMVNGTLYPCPPGYYCVAGSTSGTARACPAGYYCPTGASVGTDYPCPAGYYCLAGSTSGSSTPCIAGYFCPAGSSSGSAFPCPLGFQCPAGAAVPMPCTVNTIAGPMASACLPCSWTTYSVTAGSSTCLPCTSGIASATCPQPEITWRSSLTVISAGIGKTAANLSLFLFDAHSNATSPCAPVLMVSADAVSCSLNLFPAAASNTSISTDLQASTGNQPRTSLHLNVFIVPPPSVSLSGSSSLPPLSSGARLLLSLPQRQLTASDWTGASVTPPLTVVNQSEIWVNGQQCPSTYFASPGTVACEAPALDGPEVEVIVRLSDQFSVFGVLKDIFPVPALGFAVAPTLLLPSTAGQSINFTVNGRDLCAKGQPRVSDVVVCGISCPTVNCVGSALMCVGWPPDALTVDPPGASLHCNISALWAGKQEVSCMDCMVAVPNPVVDAVFPSTIAGEGVTIVISGMYFVTSSAQTAFYPLPFVLIGGQPCGNVSVAGQLSDILTCTAPHVPAYAPGYPLVEVRVRNLMGSVSRGEHRVAYPDSFSVQWQSTAEINTLPMQHLSIVPQIVVLSRDAASCSVAFNASSVNCAPTTTAFDRPAQMSSLTMHINVPASSTGSAAVRIVSLDALLVSAASGCRGDLLATCVDSSGILATTPTPLVISTPVWTANWDPGQRESVAHHAPAPLTPLRLNFVSLGTNTSMASAQEQMTCQTILVSSNVSVPPTVSLASVRSQVTLSRATGAVVASNFTTLSFEIIGMDATTALLDNNYTLYGECTWVTTAERIILPALPVDMPQVALHTSALTLDHIAYSPFNFTAVMKTTSSSAELSLPPLICVFQSINASTKQLRLSSVGMSTQLLLDNTHADITASISLEGPPASYLYARMVCSLWELPQVVTSAPILFRTASMHVELISAAPTTFVPSDSASPIPLDPPLLIAVKAGPDNVMDVSCRVAIAAHSTATLTPVGLTSQDTYASMQPNASGVVEVPLFGVRASFDDSDGTVTLVISCVRDTGDAPGPIRIDLKVTKLRMAICTHPTTRTASGSVLPLFAAGLVYLPSYLSAESACARDSFVQSNLSELGLPPIVCSIKALGVESQQNASEVPADIEGSIFLQQANRVLSPTTFRADFADMAVYAPPGFIYTLELSCSMSSISVPPSIPFSIVVTGCAAGSERRGVFCSKCGSGEFSMGTEMEGGSNSTSQNVAQRTPVVSVCTKCVPAGARCADGLLVLLPNYYRPPELALEPFGPSTIVFPCYNGESCVVDETSFSYSCAYGYSGPLCSVCDAGAGYARSGVTCRKCPNPASSWTLLVALLIVVFTWLARVALRSGSERSQASIALKIAMGYIQAIGSLKAFQAGVTAAYRAAVGWTDAVSSSPLSVGALQCVWDAPFLTTYVFTILLPLLAAALVAIIYLSVSALRHCRIKRGCVCSSGGYFEEAHTWWSKQSLFTTLMFVVFVAYMAIISASLRVFDCYSPPINGVTYLREDMRIVCGAGQHVTAQVLATLALLLVGVGLPCALFVVVSRATTSTLEETSFSAKWGFLVAGYRGEEAGNAAGVKDANTRASTAMAEARVAKKGQVFLTQSWSTGSVRWWESVVLVRKVGVVFLSVLVPNAYLQSGGAALWLGGFLVLQVKMQPYVDPMFNRLELLSLTSSTATAIITSMLLQNDVADPAFLTMEPKDMSTSQWVITIALLLINFSTLAVMGGAWLYLLSAHARTVVAAWLEHFKKRTSHQSMLQASPNITPVVQASLRLPDQQEFSPAPVLANCHVNPMARYGVPRTSIKHLGAGREVALANEPSSRMVSSVLTASKTEPRQAFSLVQRTDQHR